jgi:hypothetical protein
VLDGCDALPDEDAGACQWRNESACSGLKSQTGDANYGSAAANGGDEGITALCLYFEPA